MTASRLVLQPALILRRYVFAGLFALTAACNGGGGASDSPSDVPPAVDCEVDGSCTPTPSEEPACEPVCDLARCGQADSCGGSCAPCAATESCAECSLGITLVERDVLDGHLERVVIAVDFRIPEGLTPEETILPALADLRLKLEGPMEVSRVGVGKTVLDARKDLFIDPISGKPWRTLADGSLQVLIYSTRNSLDINPGRLAVVELVRSGDADDAAGLPLVASLVPRAETFAPPAADELLEPEVASPALTVWPLAEEAE